MTGGWVSEANCAGLDASLFFPERGDMTAIRQAKAVCRGCTVRAACLAANLDELDGVFGGTTPTERQRLRMKRGRA